MLSAVLRAPTSAVSGHRGVRTDGGTVHRGVLGPVRAPTLFLLGPGMGKPGHERRRGDRGRGGAVDNRGDDARRYESEPRERADVAFGFAFPVGDIGEGLAMLDLLDPFARLGD